MIPRCIFDRRPTGILPAILLAAVFPAGVAVAQPDPGKFLDKIPKRELQPPAGLYREVEYLMFTSPSIPNPIPNRVTVNNDRWSSLPPAGEILGLDPQRQSRVIDTLLLAIRDAELYSDYIPGDELSVAAPYVAPLLELAKQAAPQSPLRRRLVAALLRAPSQDVAAELWTLGRDDAMLRPLVQQQLIRWRSPVAVPQWRDVLRADTAPPADVIAALNGLAVTGQDADHDLARAHLRPNAGDETLLAAAYAMGMLRPQSNLEIADQFIDLALQTRRDAAAMAAAYLVQNDTRPEAAERLVRILESKIQPAQQPAFLPLLANHPRAAAPLCFTWIETGTERTRRQCLDLLSVSTAPRNLAAIFGALDDSSLPTRTLARQLLLDAARDARLRPLIINGFKRKLQDEQWQAVEQAIIALVVLKQKDIIAPLAKLLKHDSDNVIVTAGWGLKELADQPAVMVGVLRMAEQRFEKLAEDQKKAYTYLTDGETKMYAQLFEMLGKNQHTPANTLMRKFIPYTSGHDELLRGTAIWALGQIYRDDPPADLKTEFQARIAQLFSMTPENLLVVYASVVAQAAFGNADAAETIRPLLGSVGPIQLDAAAKYYFSRIDRPQTPSVN